MVNVEQLKTIKSIVYNVLKEFPETRNNDAVLYVRICSLIDERVLQKPFSYVLIHSQELGFPNYESVGRTRRKLQEEHPELQADENAKEIREHNEIAYREFARL